MSTHVVVSGTNPSPPDIHICNPFFGEGISELDCRLAAQRIPVGTTYTVGGPDLAMVGSRIPWVINYDSCWISVEIAGPAAITQLDIGGLVFRSMASYLIQKCIVESGGIGGYVTYGLRNMVEYILNPTVTIDRYTEYPDTSTFVTLTISGQRPPPYQPGNTDPIIALTLSDYNLAKLLDPKSGSMEGRIYGSRLGWFTQQFIAMTRGGSRPWWSPVVPGPDEMTYECDASLGSPSEVDCLHIQWDQLSPASDTVQVGPGSTTFLHSNTCFLAISAAENLVLTWAQIRVALDTLLNTCVQDPIQASRGGKAYYQPHPQAIPIHGRRRKRQNSPTGLNALPPGSNLTIFQQTEAWENSTSELKSCTWMAVKKGFPVDKCHS